MLTVDLVRLEREQVLRLEAEISPDHAFWDGIRVRVADPVSVRLVATMAGSGELVVRGAATGSLEGECGRCLGPVRVPLEESLTMVFAPVDELGEDDPGDVRPLSESAVELDLAPSLREELILSLPQSMLCGEECRGICSGCGAGLNEEECQCPEPEVDPRWAGLKASNKE